MSDVVTYPQNTVITDPNAVSEEVQKWTLTGVGAAKKWTVELDGEKSTSANLVGNATAAKVQEALEALPGIDSGDLSVSGSAGGPYTVTFSATGSYANKNVPTPVFTAEEGSVASADVTAGGAETSAVQKGTGLANRTSATSPLAGVSPVKYREEHSGSY